VEISEIYNLLGTFILETIPDPDWQLAYVNIKLLPKNIGMSGRYADISGIEKSLKTKFGDEVANALFELHKVTTEGNKNRWNRAIFKIWPDGKFNMEFIWDQELDDELKRMSE
jgi:hypothetical protein